MCSHAAIKWHAKRNNNALIAMTALKYVALPKLQLASQ